jgi:hypothetical protein
MAASSVDICNQALSWLGADLITSLSDNSAEAKTCLANYDLLRDAVMEVREWTFAIQRLSLPPMVRAPVYGYSKQFLVPSSVIRVLSVPDSPTSGSTVGLNGGGADWLQDVEFWRMESQPEGRVILADRQTLVIRAIVRVTNEALWSPTFLQAFAARMAAEIAMPLTESRQLQSDMHELYAAKLRDAAAMDGMQGRVEKIRSDYLVRVR